MGDRKVHVEHRIVLKRDRPVTLRRFATDGQYKWATTHATDKRRKFGAMAPTSEQAMILWCRRHRDSLAEGEERRLLDLAGFDFGANEHVRLMKALLESRVSAKPMDLINAADVRALSDAASELGI